MKMSAKMMILMTVVLLLFAGSSLANDLPFEEREPEGFRGIAWGTAASQVEGLVFSKEATAALQELYKRTNKQAAPYVSVYSRTGDRLKIGDAAMTRIHYYFYNDEFYGATTYFSGKDNYAKLLAACYKKFGEPSLTEEDRVEWVGAKASIVLSQKGFFSMDAEEIKDKMEEPEGF